MPTVLKKTFNFYLLLNYGGPEGRPHTGHPMEGPHSGLEGPHFRLEGPDPDTDSIYNAVN